MMEMHDPYGPLLAGLEINLDDCRESLHLIQPYVKKLRKAYEEQPAIVDYSCPYTRKAYLLAYYPHYIEPLYWLLDSLRCDELEEMFSKKHLRGCFFGAGPAPEVIGWISFLDRYFPGVEYAIAYLLDKYTESWYGGQNITRECLAPGYWPGRRLIFKPLEYDLREPARVPNPDVERALQRSNLFVMQNCLNDLPDDPEQIMQMVLEQFFQFPEGSLFILIDLLYANVRQLMLKLEEEITRRGLGVVLRSVRKGKVELRSNIQIPHVILEELLVGKDGLKRRKSTKFFASAILRQV